MNTVVSFALGGTMDPATAALVCDGLFDRFPQLKVAIVESRAGYASYLMDSLDKKFARFGNLVPLKRKPSEYMRPSRVPLAQVLKPQHLNNSIYTAQQTPRFANARAFLSLIS